MHMHIHETGKQTTMIQFHHTGVRNLGYFPGKGNNTAIVHQDRPPFHPAAAQHRHFFQKKPHR